MQKERRREGSKVPLELQTWHLADRISSETGGYWSRYIPGESAVAEDGGVGVRSSRVGDVPEGVADICTHRRPSARCHCVLGKTPLVPHSVITIERNKGWRMMAGYLSSYQLLNFWKLLPFFARDDALGPVQTTCKLFRRDELHPSHHLSNARGSCQPLIFMVSIIVPALL